ncbi:hypothetical protein L873DRAFT_1815871 [Choiromyces venosus 120613-1]|uniref:Uncharacterized protein n=1 Tax=Choiromyces venosus 120613-1 TaxID=1336337 RepID=A0A3N4J8T3_9PEZI|nr:hypothetical protein L873DRAFT_1815871 [Choiromyces venosus 120613-1]
MVRLSIRELTAPESKYLFGEPMWLLLALLYGWLNLTVSYASWSREDLFIPPE